MVDNFLLRYLADAIVRLKPSIFPFNFVVVKLIVNFIDQRPVLSLW
jgi:hypothetical protein